VKIMVNTNKKVVVISGKIGRTGYEICRRIYESGMHLAILFADKEKAFETITRFSLSGLDCLPIECDIADPDSVRSAMAEVKEQYGGIDVVIPMLEWLPKNEDLLEITNGYWNDVLSSHLTGSFNMLQQAIPYLEKSSAPRVIFMATHGARYGDCEESLPYSIIKGGIVSLTYHAAALLVKKGITVNCLTTVGNNKIYEPEDVIVNQSKQIQPAEYSTPKDVAAEVLYLAGEESGFVTGKIVSVNSGLFNMLIPAAEFNPTGMNIGN
jgi:NAD(P)-dependent dehydrogenase (short-subunit alcohol dehydrogenase family)